ncbi:MAG: hypothetical protein IT173_04585 [Acidobacteria bacterium]|nr:hypothetical protein [Acidobacteriota bacterium]
MKFTFALIMSLMLAGYACTASPAADGNKEPQASSPSTIETDRLVALDSEIVHLAQERLLRASVSVDSVLLLSDKTTTVDLDSLPDAVPTALGEVYRQANTAAATAVHTPFDVYAKIIPVSVSGTANDTLKSYQQKDKRVTAIVEFSATGVTYRDGPARHFKQDPAEIFDCVRITSADKPITVNCLYTTYDADRNIFTDRLFELTTDGHWVMP